MEGEQTLKKRDEEKGTGVTTKNEDEERGEREEERNLARRRRDEIAETSWYEWNTRGNEKGRATKKRKKRATKMDRGVFTSRADTLNNSRAIPDASREHESKVGIHRTAGFSLLCKRREIKKRSERNNTRSIVTELTVAFKIPILGEKYLVYVNPFKLLDDCTRD